MADFKTMWVNIAIFGLLIFALMGVGIKLQTDNATNETLLSNSLVNSTYNSLNSSLSDFETTTKAQKESFESESPTAGFGSLILFSVVSAGKVFTGLIFSVYNVLIKLPASALGLGAVGTGVLTSVLIVLIVLGLWALYKLGG